MKAFLCGLLVAVSTLFAHYYIHVENKVSMLSESLRINTDQLRDYEQQLTALQAEKDRSYIAGILDTINKPDHYSKVWHEGYDRGTATQKDLDAAIEKSGVQNASTNSK